MFLVCERWVAKRMDCYFDPSSSDHSSTSSSSCPGLLNRGSLRAQSPLSSAGSHFGILSPTNSNCSGHLVIVLRPPASAVLPLIYTGASLDWRLGRGSIYNNTIEKRKNTLIPRYWLKSATTALLSGLLWFLINHEGWYAVKEPKKCVWVNQKFFFLTCLHYEINLNITYIWIYQKYSTDISKKHIYIYIYIYI